MSGKNPKAFASRRQHRLHAQVFAALGDETRLLLILKLGAGTPLSIVQLTEGSKRTRQAITKHLRVLEDVGLVSGERSGRERLYRLEAEPLQNLKEYLDLVAAQWDDALSRLKGFVEK